MTENKEGKSKLEEELQHAGPETRNWYLKLLARFRVEKTAEVKGRYDVSDDEKLALLNKARQKAQYGNADSEKMAQQWDEHDQRPPIGGAQTEKD